MWALFKRELNGFFNSLTAYVVVAVFLVSISLFLWVFPVDYNIILSGHASLEGLFVLAPFVFLFLVPAITMRFFADELRSGTIEMLMTKPVTDLGIIMAKYLAGVVLVVASLLPTLLYLLTVVIFAGPQGVDMGGVWGSYLGLLFLGMVFVSVGLFASSLSDNQIVAFITGLFLCGFLFIGFELLQPLAFFGRGAYFLRELGLYAHYTSMSRGVIDSRDVLYFAGVIVLFIVLTKFRTNTRTFRRQAGLQLMAVLLLVVAVNLLGGIRFARFDLTSEKRYSLTRATRQMLAGLDDTVFFKVYLEGNLPAEFRRLRNETREMLDEFSAYSDHIQFEFINPSQVGGGDPEQVQRLYRNLAEKGLEPAQVQLRTGDGTSQRVLFPGALVSYGDREVQVPMTLLEDHLGLSIQEVLHNSVMALEYRLASTILKLSADERQRVGFLEGNGELPAREVASITRLLEEFYDVQRVEPGGEFDRVAGFRTLISARPLQAFSEADKLVLDQFLMQGGSMLWMIDAVYADMDSLRQANETMGAAWNINMDDFFFKYGARLNPVLVKDLNAAPYPVITGYVAGRPQINLLPWPFFPLITPTSDHGIVRNLNVIRTEFISSIDTVGAPGVKKQILLKTSPYSRIMPVPVRISLDILGRPADETLYRAPPQPVAVLLEGEFESLYRHRILPDARFPEGFRIREASVGAAMILVADGNLARNQFGAESRPLPAGYDRFSGQQFGNADFILNAVNYLADDSGIIEARARDIRLRLLDAPRVEQQQTAIQLVNTLVPVLLLAGFGVLRLLWRKRRYTK